MSNTKVRGPINLKPWIHPRKAVMLDKSPWQRLSARDMFDILNERRKAEPGFRNVITEEGEWR